MNKAELSAALTAIRQKTKKNAAYKPTQAEFNVMLEAAQLIDKEDPDSMPITDLVKFTGKQYGLTC